MSSLSDGDRDDPILRVTAPACGGRVAATGPGKRVGTNEDRYVQVGLRAGGSART
jgi:hypothetical protein